MRTSYVPSTENERREMLSSMGLSSIEELLTAIPQTLRVPNGLSMPNGKSELEVSREVTALATENHRFQTMFRGAGAYRHFIPAVVRSLSSREEFVTAYTPYQAELSQGVLAGIFEYQTMICRLTGMDVSNASVYDGASAAAEAALLSCDRKRSTILLSQGLHPDVLRVIQTYCAPHGITIKLIPMKDGVTDQEKLKEACGSDAACVLFAQPNYFGSLEDGEALCALAHDCGAKAAVYANPLTLALLPAPAEYGADIAVGDCQPLGLPLSFGGPYAGFMAVKQPLARKLPGRIVGQTEDASGNRAFVLTLQAREQHIRREKASSSICSNQALCALTVTIYLSAMGSCGLLEAARQCYDNAHAAAKLFSAIEGFALSSPAPFFHEFVLETVLPAQEICDVLEQHDILAGLPLDEHHLLWCVTEMNTKEEIEQVAHLLAALSLSGKEVQA